MYYTSSQLMLELIKRLFSSAHLKWASVAFVLSVFRKCDLWTTDSRIRPPGIRRLVVWLWVFSAPRTAPGTRFKLQAATLGSFIHSPCSVVVHSRAGFRLKTCCKRICVGFTRPSHRTAALDCEEPCTGKRCRAGCLYVFVSTDLCLNFCELLRAGDLSQYIQVRIY